LRGPDLWGCGLDFMQVTEEGLRREGRGGKGGREGRKRM